MFWNVLGISVYSSSVMDSSWSVTCMLNPECIPGLPVGKLIPNGRAVYHTRTYIFTPRGKFSIANPCLCPCACVFLGSGRKLENLNEPKHCEVTVPASKYDLFLMLS